MGRSLRTFVLVSFLATVSSTALSLGIVENENGDFSLEATGSARITGVYLINPDIGEIYSRRNDGLGNGVLRLMLDGDLGQHMTFHVNSFAGFSRQPLLDGGSFSDAGSSQTPYRTEYLSWNSGTEDDVRGFTGLDRFSLHLLADPLNLTVGRFAVNHSVTYIFTPNDFFAPMSATAINRIYKPGVDAIKAGWSPGMLSTIELVGVMGSSVGDEPSWAQSAVVLRAGTVLWDFEWAALGGKLAERWMAGFSFQGEIKTVGVRGEGHVGFPDANGDGQLGDLQNGGQAPKNAYAHLAGGVDHLFPWRNASLGMEYQFISDGGKPGSYLARATRFYPDDVLFMGMHYVGVTGGFDILPILRVNAVALFNAYDLSGMGFLSLMYNMSDETDLIFGAMIPWGEKPTADAGSPLPISRIESEFGLASFAAFLEMRSYF